MEVCIGGVWKPLVDITEHDIVIPEGGMNVHRPMFQELKFRFQNEDEEWVYFRLVKGEK